MNEFDKAIAPWLVHMFEKYPKVLDGKHYWSLSWLPDELREQVQDTDDLSYFSWGKRILMKICMAVPSNMATAKTSKAAQLGALVSLVACLIIEVDDTVTSSDSLALGVRGPSNG